MPKTMKKLVLGSAMLLAAAVLPPSCGAFESTEENFTKIMEIHDRNNFEKLLANPKKHEALLKKAFELTKNGNELEQATAWMDIADVRSQRGDVDGTIEALGKIRQLNEDGKIATLFGLSFSLQLRRSKEAIEDFIRVNDDKEKIKAEIYAKHFVAERNAMSPSEIWNAFNENQIAAEDKYKGQIFGVKGRIGRIAALPDGRPLILFHADRYGFKTVGFVFEPESRNEIAKMKKGRTALLGGECTGFEAGQVLFADSFVVPEEKDGKK